MNQSEQNAKMRKILDNIPGLKGFETPEMKLERLQKEEPKEMRKLRFLFAQVFASLTGSPLYTDDGEYSHSASFIDFRRDSIDEIEKKIGLYWTKKRAQQESKK